MTALRPTARLLPLALATVAALVAALGVPTAAQQIPADPVLRDFEPIGDFVLELGGADQPNTKVFRSRRAGSAVLLIGPGLPGALLVSPRTKAVERYEASKVVVGPDGVAFVLADAVPASESTYTVAGRDIAFTVGGKPARLKERAPLLGLHPGPDLTRHDPGYAFRSKQYRPSDAVLRAVRSAAAEPVRVRVYFGSWCPHCADVVPKILKVAESLAGTPVRFEYYGLPLGFGNEPEARRANISAVPTAVLYSGGKEIARIGGNEWSIPELALKKALDKGRQAGR
jgi:thiol-disulfide isomerase/thioredoxin